MRPAEFSPKFSADNDLEQILPKIPFSNTGRYHFWTIQWSRKVLMLKGLGIVLYLIFKF